MNITNESIETTVTNKEKTKNSQTNCIEEDLIVLHFTDPGKIRHFN
jgi:hypothetical protein